MGKISTSEKTCLNMDSHKPLPPI